MKKTEDFLYDFEVELANAAGKTTVIRIGYSPSATEASERALKYPPQEFKDGATVKSIRTVQEHAPRSTPLGALTVSWEPVENPAGQRFVLRDAKGRQAASEYQGGHMQTAHEFLTREQPGAAWKTVEMLTSLRQAIREDSVNCRTVELEELLAGKPTRERVSGYLFGARARDRVHHGSNTF